MARGKHKKRRLNHQRNAQPQKPKSETPPVTPTPPEVPKEQPQIPNPPSGNEAVGNQDDRKHEATANRSPGLQDWFAGCLVLITLAQAVVGYWQWSATHDQYNAMIEQNKIAQRQLEHAGKASEQTDKTLALMQADQRPWVEIQTPTLASVSRSAPNLLIVSAGENPKIPETGDIQLVEFTFKNLGKTPAYLQRVDCFGTKASKEKPFVMEGAKFERFDKAVASDDDKIIVPPDGMHSLYVLPITEPVTGSWVSVVGVNVIYKDTAGQSHASERWFIANESFTSVRVLPGIRNRMD